MSDIIRALAAIKGQQEYHKYDKDKIDKEGIVLTNRNAEAAIMALEKQLPKKVYHFLDDDTFETTCCGLDVTNTDYDYCPECGCLLGEVEEVRMRMNKQEIEKALGFINDLMSDNTDDLLFDSEIGETIKSALQQQLTGGWIPVSERLPEEDIYCYVTIKYKDNEPMVRDGYYLRKSGFSWSHVIAYIPKTIWPKEPYKEGENETT